MRFRRLGFVGIESLVRASVTAATNLEAYIKARGAEIRGDGHVAFVHLKTGVGWAHESTHRQTKHGASAAVFIASTQDAVGEIEREVEQAVAAIEVHHLVRIGECGIEASSGVVVFELHIGGKGPKTNHGIHKTLFVGMKGITQLEYAITRSKATVGIVAAEAFVGQATARAADEQVIDHAHARAAAAEVVASQGGIAIGTEQTVDWVEVDVGETRLKKAKSTEIAFGLCTGEQATSYKKCEKNDFFHGLSET